MNKTIVEKLEESEIVLFLVDAKKGLTPEDKKILKRIESKNALLINKIDGLSKEEIMDAILKYKDIYPFKEIVPISGRRGDNVDSLIKTIKKYLVESDQKFYDEERLTFNTTEFLISEIVREKF